MAFDDDSIVKMKSTYLGLLVASLMFSDAVFNRGGYFGRRLARYMPSPVSTQRLAFGMATLGLVMAGLNYFVAEHFRRIFGSTTRARAISSCRSY